MSNNSQILHALDYCMQPYRVSNKTKTTFNFVYSAAPLDPMTNAFVMNRDIGYLPSLEGIYLSGTTQEYAYKVLESVGNYGIKSLCLKPGINTYNADWYKVSRGLNKL